MKISVQDVVVPERRARELQEAGVLRLMESIQKIGQLSPISVTRDLRLIFGQHRLVAHQRLGLAEIDANVLDLDDVDRELAEIDENLIRSELTAQEHARQTARRKALYEAKYPEAPKGRGGSPDRGQNETVSFCSDTATKTGQSERTVQLDVQIGEMPDEIHEAIRGTPVADRKRDLIDLARMESEEQAEVAEVIAAGASTVAEAVEAKREGWFPPATIADTPEERARIFREEREKRRAAAQERKESRNRELADASTAAAPAIEGVDLRLCDVAALLTDPSLVGAAELIHADPPWSYDRNDRNGAAERAYDLLDLPAIVAHLDASYDLALPDARLLLWVTDPKLRDWFMASTSLRWRFVSAGGWVKTGAPGIGDHWRGDHEPLLMYVKGSPTKPLALLSNAHQSPRSQHSEKPEGWLRDLVANLTGPQALVVDLYAGRAPLARACRDTGRRYVGAEIDPGRRALALGAL